MPADEEKGTMKAMQSVWLAGLGGLMMICVQAPAHAGPGVGACCLPDGTCEVGSELICLLAGGAYQGDGIECDMVECEGAGACCFADFTCQTLVESECDELGGSYQGHETECAPGICPAVAACCFGDGRCELLTPETCLDAGGTFAGTHADCTTTDCFGACCFFSGYCVDDISRDRCESLYGLFKGFGTSCESVECATLVQERTYSFDQRKLPTDLVFEFDRFVNTSCRELRAVVVEFTGTICAGVVLENMGEQGIPTGIVVNESLHWDFPTFEDPYPAIDVVDEIIYCGDEEYLLPPGESCDYGGLLFWPEDPPARLTLVYDEADELLDFLGFGIFEAAVESAGYVGYAGVDFNLTNNPHRVEGMVRVTYQYEWLGACCFYDGSCELLTWPECDALGDPIGSDTWSVSWSKGLMCEDVVCPVFGACCLDAGCVEMTQEACEAEEGGYQGDGSSCATAICPGVPWGACCYEGGLCTDGYTQAECEQTGGIFVGFGSECAFIECSWILPSPGLPWAADFSGNGAVAAEDVIILLDAWGEHGGAADLDEDGTVGSADMTLLLSNWGPCPPLPDREAIGKKDDRPAVGR
jgi:hypothetical protein